jgi:SlyX protein
MTDQPKTEQVWPPQSLAARIDALEVRIAYQDETIETLNKTITEQWRKIDALGREVINLRERLDDAEMKSGAGTAQEPPPHY